MALDSRGLVNFEEVATIAATMNIGYAILGIVFAVIMAVVAVLVGGIFSQVTQTIFTQLNISATNQAQWYTLYTQSITYATTGISIAIVALVFLGIGVLLWAVVGMFGGGFGMGGRRGM